MRVHTYAPSRKEYNDRIKSQKHCEFCDRAVVARQACPSLGSEYWHVLAAKYPYLDGNVLIVPKRHIEQLERITAEEWADLHGVIIHSKKILKGLFDAGGFNMAINIGKESGASIKHLHWQLLPRKKGQRQASLNIIADLQLISVSGDDLKEMIEKGGRG